MRPQKPSAAFPNVAFMSVTVALAVAGVIYVGHGHDHDHVYDHGNAHEF